MFLCVFCALCGKLKCDIISYLVKDPVTYMLPI